MELNTQKALELLLSERYFSEFEVIDGLNQHPKGHNFYEWLYIQKIISQEELIAQTRNIETDHRDTQQFKSDLKYHAIRFSDFILKNAETHMDASGMFTFKRPNGDEKSSSELYADWLYEYGPQETLSQILEETRRKQEEILKQKNNSGDPLENLKPIDI